jgi:pyruvate ferredoxin oxidoreductase, beta subunit (EC 1.2.7.1)
MWFNLEYEDGKLRVTTKVPKRKPVKEYLSLQGRFSHLTDDDIKIIQQMVDENVKKINEIVGEEAIGPLA